MEEPPFLIPVQRIVGGVEIKDDLLRHPIVRLQEQLDRQRLDRRRVIADLVIARRFQPAQLQPVQRRLARHRRAVLPPRRKLARQHRHHRIVPQIVVIVEVLISKRDRKHPLTHQRRNLVLDQLRATPVAKARRKATNQINGPIRRAQKQGSRIRCH